MEGEGWCEYGVYHPDVLDAAGCEAWRVECVAALDRLPGYLWHQQSLNLQPAHAQPPGVWHLAGRTEFGDGVDDEWFIVSLLLQLTRLQPGLVAKIHDHDGQFLLIEAGPVLPRWITPDTADGRVYLCAGELHVIPRPRDPVELVEMPVMLTLPQALAAVRGPRTTAAAQPVQAAISQRVGMADTRAAANRHTFRAVLPRRAGSLLAQLPWLASAAVDALCNRDLHDMKTASKMARLGSSPGIQMQVTLPRLRYAQLASQQFTPPGCFEPVAPELEESWLLGCKLAAGLEMVCSQAASAGPATGVDLEADPNWGRFRKSLDGHGFFRGELEGSVLHNQLLRAAKEHFVQSGMAGG